MTQPARELWGCRKTILFFNHDRLVIQKTSAMDVEVAASQRMYSVFVVRSQL